METDKWPLWTVDTYLEPVSTGDWKAFWKLYLGDPAFRFRTDLSSDMDFIKYSQDLKF